MVRAHPVPVSPSNGPPLSVLKQFACPAAIMDAEKILKVLLRKIMTRVIRIDVIPRIEAAGGKHGIAPVFAGQVEIETPTGVASKQLVAGR